MVPVISLVGSSSVKKHVPLLYDKCSSGNVSYKPNHKRERERDHVNSVGHSAHFLLDEPVPQIAGDGGHGAAFP